MALGIVFDDGRADLGPLTDLRASFEVRTGALTTLKRHELVLEAAGCSFGGFAALDGVAELVGERVEIPEGEVDSDEMVLMNGRCVLLGPEDIPESAGEVLVDGATGAVLCARLSAEAGLAFLEQDELADDVAVYEADGAMLLDRPWDVIRHRNEALAFDLAVLLQTDETETPDGVTIINPEAVRIDPSASVSPSVVIDAENGPVVVAPEAVVRPGAVIVGPAFIGRGSTVIEKTLVKANTAIGPVCKVAGEVGGTIFQGYANKAHDGHLGDSWVGEWANLGAGTTNSNLLNTYGEIVCCEEPGAPRERSGMMYLGAIIGDHVKTAIMTRIMTGSVFGTGAMIAQATPPTTLGRFEWITDERRQAYRLSKFVEVAKTVMGRRDVEMSAAYESRLGELHAIASES